MDNWQPWVFIGIPIVIIIAVVIFWQSISNWWNGPAEEENAVEKDVE
jgi:hypothetical protein